MIRFFTNREAATGTRGLQPSLGRLEFGVMEILWSRGESCVRDVIEKLNRPLAYTTVMTTLDRLYKKGLLARRKSERAFLYSPRFSRPAWERKRAGDLVAGFLSGPQPSRDLLVSCLVDAVGQHDEALLDELEKKIRAKRREMIRRGQP
jgi:predicted transcriptional regulator